MIACMLETGGRNLAKPNREYKASLFSSYLSDEKRLLELFNALENTSYPEGTPVDIVTLDDVFWMDNVNDLAFVVNNQLIVLLEHQSTVNPNMPLRFLIYLGREYEKLIPGEARYRRRKVQLPTPKFVVLYNGQEPMEDYMQLKLSGLYTHQDDEPQLELLVDVYNINYGHNRELLEKSRSLQDYSLFVSRINEECRAGKELEEAIPAVIKWCKENNIMQEYLNGRESEVHNMIFGEWDWDVARKVWREEDFEEGLEQGLEQGLARGMKQGSLQERKQTVRKLSHVMAPEQIAETLELPLEFVQQVLQEVAGETMQ